ncbi:MAG: putative sensor domain DACNV-containing protein [Polyangiaceae bacterium]|jgi:hypothetical protein
MAVDYAYPPQLAQFLRHAWEATPDAPPLVDQAHLERVLTVAYQASLLRDEDRPVRLRLVVAPPEDFDPRRGPPEGLQPLVFDEPLAYTPEELRRLSVAAKYHRALIGVSPRPVTGKYGIWGMVQSGPGWIQVAQGGRGPAPAPPPSALVVRVLGPGRIAVGRGLTTLAELRAGVVGSPGMDIFGSKWMPASFASTRAELATLHAEARSQAEGAGERWADLGPDVIRLVSQAMVRRFLAAMSSAHHGGTVIVLPTERAAELVGAAGPLRMKYAFRDGEPLRRYRRLILGLMGAIARVGGAAGVATVDGDTYVSFRDDELASLRDAIFEMSQLIAALSEVDGAVVMTRRFDLLGFGAEILGDLPDVHHVARALDLEAVDRVIEPLLADGTRHRSAYRLCKRVQDALALVVSQDGGVRFVAMHDGEVTFWEHAVEMLDA